MNIFDKISDMIIDRKVNRFLNSKCGKCVLDSYVNEYLTDEELYEITDHYIEYTGDEELLDEDALDEFIDKQIVYRHLM